MRNGVTSSETPDTEPRYLIRSAARVLEVLACFNGERPALSLADLARLLGWSKPTVFRFAYTLQSLGYLEQDADTRKYRLAVRVLDLGFSYISSLGFPRVAHPFLERLAAETREAANMGVLDGAEIVYVARVSSRRLMSVNVQVGARLPAHCTALGKVLLAYRPWAEVAALYGDRPLAAYGPRTITRLDDLRAALTAIRQQGYGFTDEEAEEGLHSVAAPVYAAAGTVVAAINIGAPVGRISPAALRQEIAPRVVQTAQEISEALGYRGAWALALRPSDAAREPAGAATHP